MSARWSSPTRVPARRDRRTLVRAGGAVGVAGLVLLSQTGAAGGDPARAGRAPDAPVAQTST